MQALDIISQIDSIYKRYNIPKNLQHHMKLVAAVGELICDKWTGPKVDTQSIIAALLIHDLGNIVKYDLDSPEGLKMLGSERKRLPELKLLKQEYQEKYSKNDHEATIKILHELKIDKSIIKVVDDLELVNASKILKSTDINLKIALYADFRVNPGGVVMLKERFADIKHRYKTTIHTRHPNFEELEIALYKIEAEIFQHLSMIAEEISDFTVSLILDKRDAGL